MPFFELSLSLSLCLLLQRKAVGGKLQSIEVHLVKGGKDVGLVTGLLLSGLFYV